VQFHDSWLEPDSRRAREPSEQGVDAGVRSGPSLAVRVLVIYQRAEAEGAAGRRHGPARFHQRG
jgi:hypothetical protein